MVFLIGALVLALISNTIYGWIIFGLFALTCCIDMLYVYFYTKIKNEKIEDLEYKIYDLSKDADDVDYWKTLYFETINVTCEKNESQK